MVLLIDPEIDIFQNLKKKQYRRIQVSMKFALKKTNLKLLLEGPPLFCSMQKLLNYEFVNNGVEYE